MHWSCIPPPGIPGIVVVGIVVVGIVVVGIVVVGIVVVVVGWGFGFVVDGVHAASTTSGTATSSPILVALCRPTRRSNDLTHFDTPMAALSFRTFDS
jgi:hypothetical protein